MIKYRYIFIPVILLLLGSFTLMITVLLTDITEMFSNEGINTGSDLNIKLSKYEEGERLSDSIVASNIGYYETIEEIIARIKRDVVVTATIIGTPGQEYAMFKIEGLPDQSFKINMQLMGGFIITKITQNQIELKNQIGDESFSLKVR